MTTHPIRYAVRYREPGHFKDTLEEVTTPIDAVTVIKDLAVERGIIAHLVEVTYTPVHPDITEQARREAVEGVVAEWLDTDREDELDEATACTWLARLTAGTYADQLTDEMHEIPNACRRTWWLDEAAFHLERLLKLVRGSTEYDRDKEASAFGHAVAVLSGAEPHTTDGRVCDRCYAVTPATKTPERSAAA